MQSDDSMGFDAQAPEQGFAIDVKGLLHTLMRQSWVILVIGLAAALAGAWYANGIRESYSSTAVVQVETQEHAPIKTTENENQDLRNPEAILTIVENFRNRSLLQRVVRALDLTKAPDFSAGAQMLSEASVVNILQHTTTAAVRPKTRLIDVTASHPNPEMARKIADSMVEEFLKQEGEQRYAAIETRNAVLLQKSAELRTKLDQSEATLQEYQRKQGAVSLEESRTLVTAKLSTLSAQLTAARSDVRRLEGDLEQVRKAGDRTDALLQIGSIAKDPTVVAAREKIAAQENDIASLTERYRGKHPRMIEAQSQLQNLRQAFESTVGATPGQLANALAAARTEERNLTAAVEEQQKAALDLDEKLMPFKTLQREIETDRALYEAVLTQLKQSTMVMGVDSVAFRVVEPAVPSPRLASKRLMIILGAGFFGLLVGTALVVGLFLLDSSVRTVDDAERLFQLPVLAAIPALPKPAATEKALALLTDPASAAAESFRSLRTSLTLSGPQGQSKVILVTSAVAGEGKTLTSANIAIAFAQQGLNTLLIDADLRRPALGNLFDIPPHQPGLADCLVGHTPELTETRIPNLTVLPSGPRAVFPAELLTGPAMTDLVAVFGQQFSRIIIDSAPVNLVSDTLNFAVCASAVCLVVQSRKTPVRLVQRAIELLRRVHVRPIGIALNRLPRSNSRDYHYYYGPNDTYGGGYGKNSNAVPHQPPNLAAAKVIVTPPQEA